MEDDKISIHVSMVICLELQEKIRNYYYQKPVLPQSTK